MNIVFLDIQTVGNVPNLNVIKNLGSFTSYALTPPTLRLERMKHAEVVITNKVIIDKDIIDQCPDLKLICVAATGVNNIDVAYAQTKGIQVRNAVDYSSESVAQITVGMILNLINRFNYFDTYVKSGNYSKSDMFTHFGPTIYQLNGKRLGIIGLGNIGKRVAKMMEAFGMEVVYYSTSGKNNDTNYKKTELDDLLKTSDIVTIHAPLNEQTKNLISLEKLKLMKPSAFIVNNGRGGIVNESDLIEALNSNIIAGAGTDVFEKEPILTDSPFYRINNPDKLLLTPHIAWTSMEARITLIEKIAENIKEYIHTKK